MTSHDPVKTDLVTPKSYRDFKEAGSLHEMALERFKLYLADLADAERERCVDPVRHGQSTPGSSVYCVASRANN